MKLTRLERNAMLAGQFDSLTRPTKPDVELGFEIVVQNLRAKRYWDRETGSVFGAPKQRVLWITVRQITRHRKGHYVISYDVVDNRETALLLASGGGYTTNREHSIDENEVRLSDKDRKRLSVESRTRAAALREQKQEAEDRHQMRVIRAKMTKALKGLDPQARIILLASFERQLDAIEDEQKAA